MGRSPTTVELKGPARPSKEWPTAELEYVYSPEPVTLRELSVRWDCALSTLEKRSMASDPAWGEKRAQVQDEIRQRIEQKLLKKISDEMSQGIFDANMRHRRAGLEMQAVARSTIKVRGKGDARKVYLGDPKTGEQIPVRAAEVIRFFREGVRVEREALGLADRVVRAQFVRDVVDRLRVVIEKYVVESVTYGNIVREFSSIVRVESESFEAYVSETFGDAEK